MERLRVCIPETFVRMKAFESDQQEDELNHWINEEIKEDEKGVEDTITMLRHDTEILFEKKCLDEEKEVDIDLDQHSPISPQPEKKKRRVKAD